MNIVNVEAANIFVNVKMCKLKATTLADVKQHIKEGHYAVELCKLVEAITLTVEEYDELVFTLGAARDWIAGKGGTESFAPTPDGPWHQWPIDAIEAWKKQSYTLVLSVFAVGRAPIYLNPQGYNYARYVGILLH